MVVYTTLPRKLLVNTTITVTTTNQFDKTTIISYTGIDNYIN